MKTLERLRSIINENSDYKDEICLKDHLVNDLYLNSFDMLMVVQAIEDNYSIQIDMNELEGIVTIEDMVKKLEKINAQQNEYS